MKNLKKKLINKLGGYNSEEMEEAKNKITPHEALTELVKDKFNTISKEDVLKETRDGWLFEGTKIPAEVIKVLSGQADAILRMKVWEVIKKDAQFVSNQKMFIKSQSENDLIAGKLLLYLFDVIESRLKSISSGKGDLKLE